MIFTKPINEIPHTLLNPEVDTYYKVAHTEDGPVGFTIAAGYPVRALFKNEIVGAVVVKAELAAIIPPHKGGGVIVKYCGRYHNLKDNEIANLQTTFDLPYK